MKRGWEPKPNISYLLLLCCQFPSSSSSSSSLPLSSLSSSLLLLLLLLLSSSSSLFMCHPEAGTQGSSVAFPFWFTCCDWCSSPAVFHLYQVLIDGVPLCLMWASFLSVSFSLSVVLFYMCHNLCILVPS